MSMKKRVIENSILYSISSLLTKALAFLMLPVFTFYLSVEEYGSVNLVVSFINVANFIVAFSLYSAAKRFYVDYKDNPKKLNLFYSSLINFIGISGLLFFIISLLFRDLFMRLFFENIEFYPLVFIGLSSVVFVSLHMLHQSILQGSQQGRKLTIINFVTFIFTIVLKLTFIIPLNLGAFGFMLAQLVINVLYFFYMLYDLIKLKLYSIKINFRLLIDALKYSIPLIPHNLSTRISALISRIFLNKAVNLVAVGIFSVSMQFATLIDIVQVSVNKAFQPWIFQMMKNGENTKKIIDFSMFLLIIYSTFYLTIGLFSQEVILVMTPANYDSAWLVVPILVVSFSIKSMYYFYVNVIMYSMVASKKLFYTTIISSLLDVVLAMLLIPHYGLYGAAFAFLFGKILLVFLVKFLSNYSEKSDYNIIKMLKLILPSIFFLFLGLIFSYTRYQFVLSFFNILYKLSIFLIYLIFIYFSNKKLVDTYIWKKKAITQ